MRIDPHVHCRDGNQAYKTTIAEVLRIAEFQGVGAICDMPNTDPPIICVSDVEERLKLVPTFGREKYFLYIGLTTNYRQIVGAVECWHRFKEVVGLKMFAGRSVGPLAVIEDEGQKNIYKTLAGCGYNGVLAVHCEKEANLMPDLWKPSWPASHCMARPKEAEISSVTDQINFAGEAGFGGVLHICHVSCSETVTAIIEGRRRFAGQMKITCGVTPHHLMFSIKHQEEAGFIGNFFKVNPPIRDEDDREVLLDCVCNGYVSWIETDHAPHSWSEKFMPPYLSGIPSLFFYNDLISLLLSRGMSPKLIDAMTRKNIIDAFSPKLDHLIV